MSEPLRVALIAEGSIDSILIEAALKAVFVDRAFILTLLQPEPTRPKMGTGWCGVFKWCRELAERGYPSLEQDPTLEGFDLFVLHLDADVAGMKYGHGGPAVVEAARALLALPCEEPCPPPRASVEALRARLLSWLGVPQLGPHTILCMPSKAIEAWFAAAILPEMHELLLGLECNPNLAAQLAQLPKEERIKKEPLVYRARASELTRNWERVELIGSQARNFADEARSALATHDAKAAAKAAKATEDASTEPAVLADEQAAESTTAAEEPTAEILMPSMELASSSAEPSQRD